MHSPNDGKMHRTDVMDIEQILRLIQSVPSNKAEPFKLWLAKVGNKKALTSIFASNYPLLIF